jgi:hypothetical protein
MNKYGLDNLSKAQLEELKKALSATVSIAFWVSKFPAFLVIKISFKNGDKKKRIVDVDGKTKIGDAQNDFETFTCDDVTIAEVDAFIAKQEQIESQPIMEFDEDDEYEEDLGDDE